jgi:hypothetical protein
MSVKEISPPPIDPNLHKVANPKDDFESAVMFIDLQSKINDGYALGISDELLERDLSEYSDLFVHGYHLGLKDRHESIGPYKDLPLYMIANLLYTIVLQESF